MASYKPAPSRYAEFSCPPAVHGYEVTAHWRRTHKGEVLMTVKMPKHTVDTELYVKTSKGHSGIVMDPWTSFCWRKTWSRQHTPNKVTKAKLDSNRKEEGQGLAYLEQQVEVFGKIKKCGHPGP